MPRLPTAVLSVAFGLIAIVLFTCGMILDTIVKANRRQWELTVYEIEHRTREERALGAGTAGDGKESGTGRPA